jgi:hypothetical protein
MEKKKCVWGAKKEKSKPRVDESIFDFLLCVLISMKKRSILMEVNALKVEGMF